MSAVSPTCCPGDGNLAAADALPALAEGFNLDDVVLVDGQRQLQGGGVGLHHTGPAVFVQAVHDLQVSEKREAIMVRGRSMESLC